MTIHRLHEAPSPALAAALASFEEQFRYPLGPGRTFRISHGDDYPRFYRALGDSACFVAESAGGVSGVLCVAARRLALPGGVVRPTLYVGDVKVAPTARGGFTLLRLGLAARAWIGSRVDAAIGIVMDGTRATPDRYTGRFGIPHFARLGSVTILRLSTRDSTTAVTDSVCESGGWMATPARGAEAFARLSADGGAFLDGDSAERSVMEPCWMVHPSGAACGRLEDTRRAKRLFDDRGEEMRSAHLSSFAFSDPAAGIELLRAACSVAAAHGEPALFVSIPADRSDTIRAAFESTGVVAASATIYGAGLEPARTWYANTAEI